MKLYEIATNHNNALLNMAEIDGLDEQCINDTMELLEGDFKSKAISVAAFFQNQEVDINAMKEAEKRIATRRKSLESKIAWMKNYLLSNMQRTGITVIECPEFKISIRNNPESVHIDNPGAVPMKYQKVEYTPDKTALKKAIQDGALIEGVSLVRGQALVIK